jgi:O-antigen/teichoic acid export membrane protein
VSGAPQTAEPLARTAGRALWWSIANNSVGRLGTTLVGVVLARILVPEDYGMYAVALVALNGLLSVNELGVSLAVVRWPGDVARIAPTVKSVALACSFVLWIATFFAAPLFASALNAPDAVRVVQLLTLSILIDALTAVPAALMTRDFMQRERMIVDSAGFLVSSSLAVALALAGYGVYALVWSALVGNLVNALFILRYAPRRFPFGFRRSVLPELLSFGLPLALASVLVIAMLNIDYIVVGAHLGPTQLGFYLLAFNLAMWPVNMFSAPARRISLPLFARLNAGETDASAAFVPVCALLLLVTLPACVMLAMFAEPLIRIAYGDKWLPAASVLPWLTVLALVRVVGELVYDFFVALGTSLPALALQAVWLAALVVALPLAVRAGGLQGVAMAHAAVATAIVIPAFAFVLMRAGVSVRAMAAQLFRPLTAAGLAAAAGIGGVLLVPDHRFVQMALGCALVGLVYVAIVYPMRTILKSPALGSA